MKRWLKNNISELYVTESNIDDYLLGKQKLDVLQIVESEKTPWPLPLWFLEKSSRWTARLRELGFHAAALVPKSLGSSITLPELLETVIRLKPLMVISRAFAIEAIHLKWLATRASDILFLQMNHTPNSFVLTPGRHGLVSWAKALESSVYSDNFLFGTVSERDARVAKVMAPEAKVLWIPNPCRTDLYENYTEGSSALSGYVHVGLAGRVNFQKNFKNQLDAIAIFSENNPVFLHLFLGPEYLKGMRMEVGNYARQILTKKGAAIQILPFIPPLEFINYAKRNLDLFLQATFDESFGYLIWEMMAAGIPTITSSGLEIPSTVSVPPTDVLGVVDAMTNLMQDLPAKKSLSVKLAREIECRNNRRFDEFFYKQLQRDSTAIV